MISVRQVPRFYHHHLHYNDARMKSLLRTTSDCMPATLLNALRLTSFARHKYFVSPSLVHSSMASPSALVSTSTSLVTSLTSTLTTVYQTSQPVSLTTVTSIVSQFSTFLSTVTISQSQITWASTIAIPVTLTQTMSQLLTSIPTWSIPPPPPATVEIVTSTLTSTLVQPGQTITYYPSLPPVVLPTTTTQTRWYPSTSTVTFTQADFILESPAGNAYTTIATILPLNPDPTQTNAIILVTSTDHGWDSWSQAAKGGLIAGMIIAGLLILGTILLILWCLTRRRRRTRWVQSGWVGPPQQQVVLAQPTNRAYWGWGPSGWGIRG